MTDRFAREDTYSSAGVVWSPLKLLKYGFCIIRNELCIIHLHSMEKNPGMFSYVISLRLRNESHNASWMALRRVNHQDIFIFG